jgi:phosphatidylglycerol lysyltransferase
MCYQILNPGMHYWFSPEGDAVIGYVNAGAYRVVAGEPVCAPERLTHVSASFEAATTRAGQQVCYVGAQDRLVMALGTNKPLAGLLMGALPVWRPHHWRERIRRKASLRAQLARARNKQVSVNRWPARHARNHPALRQCLDEWLQHRRLPPMHFAVEPDTLSQLEDRLVLVAEQADQVVGFLVASPIPQRNGWLIEQIIRRHRAPNGTTELLLDSAMQHLAARGADYATLGVSPLSRRAGIVQTTQPLLVRIALTCIRTYGRRLYNFEGLDTYKAKFLPEWWEPVYVLTREPHTSLRTLYAVAGAFSGTSPALYVAHGLVRRLFQALRACCQQQPPHRSQSG